MPQGVGLTKLVLEGRTVAHCDGHRQVLRTTNVLVAQAWASPFRALTTSAGCTKSIFD